MAILRFFITFFLVFPFLVVSSFADDVDDYIEDLNNEEEEVREEAAKQLGLFKDERATQPLIETLEDEEDDVVEQAVESLGQIGDPEAVEPLIDVFNESTDWGIRVKAAKALQMLGDPRAIPVLTTAVEEEENPFVLSHLRQALRSLQRRTESSETEGLMEQEAPP